MKKFLLALLAVVCVSNLSASQEGTLHIILRQTSVWHYDLESLTATRNVSGTTETRPITIHVDSFGAADARSVASLKALLPTDAQVDQWYQVKRRTFLQVEGASEEAAFSADYLLQFTEALTTDTHAHYQTGVNTPSGLNDVVVRYPVYQCTQTTTVQQVLARLANAADDSGSFVLATETIVSDHVAGDQVMKDGALWMPTNPTEQTYGLSLITPNPRGIGEPTYDARSSLAQAGKNIEGAVRDLRDSESVQAAFKSAENVGKGIGKALGLRRRK